MAAMHSFRFAIAGPLLVGLALSFQLAAADIKGLIQECEDCHGKGGVSEAGDVPTIAGISAPIHGDYLLAYQEKARPCRKSKYRHGDTSRPETDMCAIAAKLSEADIEALAEHFAAQPFVAAKQPFDAQKAAAGKTLQARDCAKCHSNGGRDPADDASILGGQHAEYLKQAFADFRSGDREQTKKMAEKLDKWSDAEIEAVIHYFASLQ
jgi:sulfide dehydrogenase cytochrome subunit